MNDNILPIGSVVKIKGLEKPIMIFGYLQKCGVEHIKIVDYIGVPYPDGNIGSCAQIGFQRHDIVETLFVGYKTDDFLPWADRIREFGAKDN